MLRIKYSLLTLLISCVLYYPGHAQGIKEADEEIGHLIRKVQQYPNRSKYLVELKEQCDFANGLNHQNITSYLKTGQPDIWYPVYKEYLQLDARQDLIRTLPESTWQKAGFVFSDYGNSIGEAKYKATAFHYAHGEKLLQSGSPADAKEAYVDFLRVAKLDGNYKQTDKNIRLAVLKGATNVEFELQNKTGRNISSRMIDHLTRIIWEFKKARYGQVQADQADKSFAFVLRIVLEGVDIGPDQYKDLEYQEERDLLKGDIVVDTIKCLVKETRQLKKARLSGSLEYFDRQTASVVNRIPISVETVFSNAYASLQGNPDAAGEETRKLLDSHKAAYPSSDQMTSDVTDEFIKKATEIILGE